MHNSSGKSISIEIIFLLRMEVVFSGAEFMLNSGPTDFPYIITIGHDLPSVMWNLFLTVEVYQVQHNKNMYAL